MKEIMQFNPPYPLNTAVLFLVFNRLDTTKQVFEAIRQAKPPRLYIASDGARANKEGEHDKVQTVREHLIQNIDWVCEIKTLFREENLGCKYAVSGAITWFFNNEEQGIILEDDCLPSQSFFWYCEELLEKYKNNNDIYIISSDSRGSESFEMKEDYSFCKYALIWGWASWANRWRDYDSEIVDWPENGRTVLNRQINNIHSLKFWENTFDKVYKNQIDTWDYQLIYLLLKNQGKSIVPRLNLVTNIGFGGNATHTRNADSEEGNRERYEIELPLNHNVSQNSEKKINKYLDKNLFLFQPIIILVFMKIKDLIIKFKRLL